MAWVEELTNVLIAQVDHDICTLNILPSVVVYSDTVLVLYTFILLVGDLTLRTRCYFTCSEQNRKKKNSHHSVLCGKR